MMNWESPRKAMILAAGRGQRMGSLTDNCPKPLLQVRGKSLIAYHIDALVRAGFSDIVINHAYLGQQIVDYIDRVDWGCQITFSAEGETGLETGGGIYQALTQFNEVPFLVVNADIWTSYDYAQARIPSNALANLVLVDNPEHHVSGDFSLQQGWVKNQGENRLTFSGIGVYRPALFSQCQAGRFPLAPLLRQHMDQQQVSGEHFSGYWSDIGTPERLALLERDLDIRDLELIKGPI